MPGIVSMTSGNVSEAQKENRTQHHPFQHSPQDKELLPPKALQSQQVNLSSVPRMGSTAIPGRGNPAARSDTDGLSTMSLSLVTGGNQHNTTCNSAVLSLISQLSTPPTRSWGGVSTSPSPVIRAMTCAFIKRTPRTPKPDTPVL